MDAITRGTLDGAQLLVNIVAMLMVLVALVSARERGAGALPALGGAAHAPARARWLLCAARVARGVPWAEAQAGGKLLGTKTVLNEFIAYLDLSVTRGTLRARSRLLMTYALCGFANFGSLGIMIGGIVVPERRAEIVGLGMKSIVAGTLATCMTAASVALILSRTNARAARAVVPRLQQVHVFEDMDAVQRPLA